MDHIGAFVSDLERAVAWCQDMLGMRLAAEDHDGGARMAVLRFGGQEVHLFEDKMGRTAPRLVYRVDAKTGEESLVRGVEMVGTPLTTVSRIVATSDTEGVFNGFCGAESGFVPVSTVAPAVLMSEIELQRTQRAMERAPLLPPPWADAPRAGPRTTGNR